MASEINPEGSRNGERNQNQLVLYQVASQSWVHAEQIRWALLYNYLMGTSILLLAWAAVFTSSHNPFEVRLVLITLAIAGLIVSLVWIPLGIRQADL